MTFVQAIKSCFMKYFTFEGRASRSEYWFFFLFIFIGLFVTGSLDNYIFDLAGKPEAIHPLYLAFVLLTFIPNIAVNIRRLHDINRTGWWYLLVFTVIGVLLILVWACEKGTAGENRFGPEPVS